MKRRSDTKQKPPFSLYNGILNVYKEKGCTSMDVCARLRKMLGLRKAGHAGTLDPMAEGVLPVALGTATKDIDRIGSERKTYRAGLLLGLSTDTLDITGRETARFEGMLPDEESVRAAVMSFLGAYEQLPPLYSAKQVEGKRMYQLARKGIEVERKAVPVEIYSVEINEISLPHVVFTVCCSKGTYVRSLCDDIGRKLGCPACMESLVRLSTGGFRAEDALRLDEIEALHRKGELDEKLTVLSPTVLCLGKFDGAHTGHQYLFRALKRWADQHGRWKTLVLMLYSGTQELADPMETKRRLYAMGIHYVIRRRLTEEMRAMSAEDFLKDVLIGEYKMQAIVAGSDVSFGYGREGNARFLEEHAASLGYEVKIIEKLQMTLGDETGEVSSSRVRSELSAGNMEFAARLLGHPFSVKGRVIHGEHIGTGSLGVPTLNLKLPEGAVLPPDGVYAVEAVLKDKLPYAASERRLPGIADLGVKPTVHDPEKQERLLETHLFDFSEELYGEEIRVELLHFLRPEQLFPSLDALREQIRETDIPAAKRYFEQKQLDSCGNL